MNPALINWRLNASLLKLVLSGCLLHCLPLCAEVQQPEVQNQDKQKSVTENAVVRNYGIPKPEIPFTESMTVEELLRLDSRAALDVARRQVFGTAPGTTSAGTSSDLPVLVAIYGTGRNLSAELLIGGRTVIYHGSGKQSVSGMAHGYALERIAPPCVYLTKDQSQQIACLEMRTP